MKLVKFDVRSVCSGDIEPELSTTHNISICGLILLPVCLNVWPWGSRVKDPPLEPQPTNMPSVAHAIMTMTIVLLVFEVFIICSPARSLVAIRTKHGYSRCRILLNVSV